MDESGVERAVVCPMDRHLAVYNRDGNDLVLSAVKRHPRRLIGLATANPWYGAGAVEEVRRALAEGLTGLKLHPRVSLKRTTTTTWSVRRATRISRWPEPIVPWSTTWWLACRMVSRRNCRW